MKLALLTLGLWLAGAQGFAASICCSDMPAPNNSCGDRSTRESPPQPSCCTTLEVQKDVIATTPRSDAPKAPGMDALLSEDTTYDPIRTLSSNLGFSRTSSVKEDLPLYLRYEVLLI